ncbi:MULTISPECIES: uroporphyrinogen-III synthase [unclassified Curtobacterium]|uniref:uroporphyrinogen-III synthase n=1 Tax=unclassified Curtobacterium TaxID=257496 RepID=UPI0038118A55
MPRGGEWGERVAAAARDRGLDPRIVPLIAAQPPADPAPLDRAVAQLVTAVPDRRPGSRPHAAAAGQTAGYAWLVVTSATAVTVIAGRVPGLPSALRVAAVGEPTARAARAAGWVVDLVPPDASAAALVAALPDTDGTVLVPRSDIAAPTLVDGLRARGIDVDDVVAYRTVGTGDEPVVLDAVPDAVLVTSGSVAREVARRMAPLDPRTVVACIGPGTASEARAAGLHVHVVATTRSADALLDAVVDINRTAPEQEGTP